MEMVYSKTVHSMYTYLSNFLIIGMKNNKDSCKYLAILNIPDLDQDGVGDLCDNCPKTYNPLQVSSSSYIMGGFYTQ